MRPGSASRARCPASGPSVERGPARRTTNATTGPTCLARPVRNVASQQAWSCQRRTPRPCRCISLRSAARWRQAVTPLSSSMAPATILLPRLRSPKTSLWCACHPMLPNSTRSKTSGNICAATNSPSPSSTTTTTSLIKPATHGTSLNKIQCASPQSPPEHGRLSMIRAVGIICPLADKYPEFICCKAGLDYLHNAKLQGKITEGYVVLSHWNDAGRSVDSVTPVADVVAKLKGTTPNQGRGRFGPFYWLTADGSSSDE